jgi:hypothetical protein
MLPHASPRKGPAPTFCAATAGGIAAVQTWVSATAKTLPTTRIRESKSPQGSRVIVQIKQYLLLSAEQLTNFSSPDAAASRLTLRVLPHVSLLCRRLRPAAESCVDYTGKRRRGQ